MSIVNTTVTTPQVNVIPATKPMEGMDATKPVEHRITPKQDISVPGVSVIPATRRSVQGGNQFHKQKDLRVAAYCRVSTGDESQQTSYTNQRAFYSGIIQSRSGWSFVGIYADEARSGTNRIHRKEFNRMIEDAKAGKIDYIMTKSISRFARNTIDTLDCVRQLRQLNPPVGIVFEKENIDTLNATGELILTILSALAQDESRSLSDNIRWTFQKNFQSGKPQINLDRMLGYDKGENGEWLINEEQAKIVRFIFEKYACGHSALSIANLANEAGMRTINGKKWRADSVLTVLRNEKYVGDLEMQKTITKDFLTHRASINRGEAPRYYVKDHHVGIVDRFTWDKVQMMLGNGKGKMEGTEERGDEEKPAKRGAVSSPFVNLICGAKIAGEDGHECGERFTRMTYSGTATGYYDERSKGFDPKTETEGYTFQYPVWRCGRKLGEKSIPTPQRAQPSQSACPSTLVQECALEQSFMEMLYSLRRDYIEKGEQSYLVTEFKEAYDTAYRRTSKNSYSIQRMELLDSQIRELEQNYQKTISRQVEAMRDAALEKHADLNTSLANGEITMEEIEINIRSGLVTGSTEIPWASVRTIEEGSEAAIYADLARDLKNRLEDYKKERATLEAEQGLTSVMKRNYDFFLQCLMELPEENFAGMKINVNGLDVDGSMFRDKYGKARVGVRSAVNTGHVKVTSERIAQAPDYLRFERGIYAAFIKSGKVKGGVVEYDTSFGVRLVSVGNDRTLSSFLGFRRCHEDGTVEFLDEVWKVNGKTITYRRKKLKRVKKSVAENTVECGE